MSISAVAPHAVMRSDSARDLTSAEEATRVPYEDDDFGFWDFVDLINPLQHLPIIGTIYRKVTGDEIKPEVQIAGSILMGAATGSILLSAATGIASVILEEEMGSDPLTMVAGVFDSDEEKINIDATNQEIMVADNEKINLDSYDKETISLNYEEPKSIKQVKVKEEKSMSEIIIQQQARIQKMSNPKEPDFVHQFMLQALDKYKTAHNVYDR